MVDVKKIHQKPYVRQYTSVSKRDLKNQYISAAHCCFNSFQKLPRTLIGHFALNTADVTFVLYLLNLNRKMWVSGVYI